MGIAMAFQVGGAILGAASSLSQASAQKSALAYERAQLEDDRRLARIQAMDEENERREKAGIMKGSQLAAAVAAGYDPFTSGSFQAIQSEEDEQAARDITGIRLMGAARDRKYGLSISANRSASRSAGTAGLFGAAGSLVKGGYQAWKTTIPKSED